MVGNKGVVMGEGLKLRKKPVEKSKEKLLSLAIVILPSELINGKVKICVILVFILLLEILKLSFHHESVALLKEFQLASSSAQQIQCLKKCGTVSFSILLYLCLYSFFHSFHIAKGAFSHYQ